MRQKLRLEAIEVESFPTTPDLEAGVGTVRGHSGDVDCTSDYVPTCVDKNTCQRSCGFGEPTVCADTCGTCPTAGTTWSDSDFTACVACTTYGHPGGGDACNPTDLGTCVNYCLG